MAPGKAMLDEGRMVLCCAYLHSNKSNKELSKSFGIGEKHISRAVQLGVELGYISQEKKDEAVRRRIDEAKVKLRVLLRGKPRSEEAKQKISNANKKLSDEQQKELKDKVIWEIGSNKKRDLERLSTNLKLAGLFGVSECSISRYLRDLLDSEDRKYREDKIKVAGGKRNIELHGSNLARLTEEQRRECGKRVYSMGKGIGGLTSEQLSVNGKKRIELHGNPAKDMTPEQLSVNGKKAYAASLGKLTTEQIRENSRKGVGKLTTEQRKENGRKNLTPEQRRENYKKGLGKLTTEQRRENGKKAFLSNQATPNGLETLLITDLSQLGLFVEDGRTAKAGQIYYPGKGEKKWYRKLSDGKHKLPDFKVKGQPKVIELYGDYWHSQEFCETRGKEDYHWNPERMIEEYAKVGIEARVYMESELKDKQRREEIIREIREWISQAA